MGQKRYFYRASIEKQVSLSSFKITILCALLLSCRLSNLYFVHCSVRNGHIRRITDPDIQSSVLEIMGTNVSTTFIQCPADPKKTLAIKLPFLVMIIKNVRTGHRNHLYESAFC